VISAERLGDPRRGRGGDRCRRAVARRRRAARRPSWSSTRCSAQPGRRRVVSGRARGGLMLGHRRRHGRVTADRRPRYCPPHKESDGRSTQCSGKDCRTTLGRCRSTRTWSCRCPWPVRGSPRFPAWRAPRPHQRRPPRPDRLAVPRSRSAAPARSPWSSAAPQPPRRRDHLVLRSGFAAARREPEGAETAAARAAARGRSVVTAPAGSPRRRARRHEISGSWQVTAESAGRDPAAQPRLDEADPAVGGQSSSSTASEGGHPPGHHGPRHLGARRRHRGEPRRFQFTHVANLTRGRRWPRRPARRAPRAWVHGHASCHLHRSRGRAVGLTGGRGTRGGA